METQFLPKETMCTFENAFLLTKLIENLTPNHLLWDTPTSKPYRNETESNIKKHFKVQQDNQIKEEKWRKKNIHSSMRVFKMQLHHPYFSPFTQSDSHTILKHQCYKPIKHVRPLPYMSTLTYHLNTYPIYRTKLIFIISRQFLF